MPKQPTNPSGLVSQKEANYRPEENDLQDCEKCASFVPPGSCVKVAGRIAPEYVCDLFQEKVADDQEMLRKYF